MTALISLIVVMVVSGCSPDVGNVVNVGPSAEHQIESIMAGVDEMNALVGEELFTIKIVDSDKRIDGEIIVRHRAEPFSNPKQTAHCSNTREGIIISIMDRCNGRCVLHELGHASGLVHVSDSENTMFEVWGKARLTEAQKQRVLRTKVSGVW
jgi:PBP1b-binding outer membrane lipoprotein LpoB